MPKSLAGSGSSRILHSVFDSDPDPDADTDACEKGGGSGSSSFLAVPGRHVADRGLLGIGIDVESCAS
jgi:hypothetical protein